MDIHQSLRLWMTCETARLSALNEGLSEEDAHASALQVWRKWADAALNKLEVDVFGPPLFEHIAKLDPAPLWLQVLGLRIQIENDSGSKLAKEFGRVEEPLKKWEKEHHIEFSGQTFEKEADFNHFVFPSSVSFSGCQFLSSVEFRKCKFMGWATFDDCIFHDSVSFARCEFVDNATFHHVHFQGDVEFGAGML